MSNKIYTKTGDKGTTSLIGGTKVAKSHLRIESYGTVDELNSFIGLLGDQLAIANTTVPNQPAARLDAAAGSGEPVSPLFSHECEALREIQDRLFTIGSSLACDPEKETKLKIPDLKDSDIIWLEKEIDAMDAQLPPMKFFVLPGGHVAVSTAHVARCVCRRAERCCVRLQEEQLYVSAIVIRYLNRMSDYLFELSRYVAHRLNVIEYPWRPRV